MKKYIGYYRVSKKSQGISGLGLAAQKSAVTKKLYELGVLRLDNVNTGVVVKPGMVNLIPNPAAGRVDMTRRNISIR